MAVARLAAACMLLLGQATARVDLSSLRSQDVWPSPEGGPGSGLTVDLGYGVYQGYKNSTSGLNIWKGIRFATPPTGDLRWQAPRIPKKNRTLVEATSFGSICYQAPGPGASYRPSPEESEDCLFVNVYAPPGVKGRKLLPVLVWIHGGAYRNGKGQNDPSEFIRLNNNSVITVHIQYRLGAFGFLASADVASRGDTNAGLLDQVLALSWVQKYISTFGGDPKQVTIGGISAGAGSVLHHNLADDGATKPPLFRYAFAASNSVSPQYQVDSDIPTAQYQAFAKVSGCGNASVVFNCLVRADAQTLQAANLNVSADGIRGILAFLPGIDGVYIKELPSVQLTRKRVNSEKLFLGNNAIEGTTFPLGGTITSKQALGFLIGQLSPLYSAENITTLLDVYHPSYNLTQTFETDGLHGATANDVSGIAVGYPQTLNNFLAELIFVCPAYWHAGAYTGPSQPGQAAYYYQFSVPIAGHAEDIYAYFGPLKANQGPELMAAFAGMLGSFVRTGNPSISDRVANGVSAPDPDAHNPASAWPAWTDGSPLLINMNTTGGTPIPFKHSWGSGIEFVGPGLRNRFTAVDARAWEGGRGQRCELLRKMGPLLPQ